MIELLIKFCVVGGSGVFVDFGITYLLKEKFSLHRYFANTAGFFSAATSNYVLNRVWTFNSTNPAIEREFTSFLLIAVIGLVINTVVLYFLSERAKFRLMPQNARLRFYLYKLFATAVVTIWNFFMNYFFTFA